jgi:hypothetical protein
VELELPFLGALLTGRIDSLAFQGRQKVPFFSPQSTECDADDLMKQWSKSEEFHLSDWKEATLKSDGLGP